MVPMMFLTERNIPKRSKYELTYNKLKIQTKTNALIYQFSEMWSIIQEKHDITVRWREKYPWVHCLSTLNRTASQKYQGFGFSCEPSNWIIGNGLRNNIYHYFILLCCIARCFFFHINYLCNKIWSSIDQRKPGPLGILSIKHSSSSQYTAVSSDDW